MNIIQLSDKSGNGKHQSPVACLKKAIQDIEEGHIDPNKILILSLDTKNDMYNTTFYQAGMVMSECLALCEVMKTRFLVEMGYMQDEE